MDDEIINRVEEARALRRDDDLDGSQALLLALLEEYPSDPLVLFEVGGSYDVLGEEEMAVPYYRQALDEGLEEPDRQEFLICLGSSLRVVGEAEEAVDVLRQASADYPGLASVKAFLALALLDSGSEQEAVATLLDALLQASDSADVQAYASALEYYRDELRGDLD